MLKLEWYCNTNPKQSALVWRQEGRWRPEGSKETIGGDRNNLRKPFQRAGDKGTHEDNCQNN